MHTHNPSFGPQESYKTFHFGVCAQTGKTSYMAAYNSGPIV